MTRLPRPCLGAVDSTTGRKEECGEPVVGSGRSGVARCPRHAAMHAAGRPSPSRRGYDRQYRRDREVTLAPDARGRPRVCSLRLEGCTYWADTADHVIPVDGGRSEAGKRGPLRPACKSCNSKRGKRTLPQDAADALAAPAPPPVAEDDDEPWWPDP